MKKKLLALVLVMAMLLSCMLMLTSCPDSTDGPSTKDPELNLNENINKGDGASDVTIVTDPTDPDAGADAEDSYVHPN